MRALTVICGGLLVALWGSGTEVSAQTAPLNKVEVPVDVDSGFVVNATARRTAILSTTVRVRQASWIRLKFHEVVLGQAPEDGLETVLRIRSLADGAVQTLNRTTLAQWHFTSAYFNGNAVRLELIADPNAEPSRVVIRRVLTGGQGGGIASLCGNDDRALSSDPACSKRV